MNNTIELGERPFRSSPAAEALQTIVDDNTNEFYVMSKDQFEKISEIIRKYEGCSEEINKIFPEGFFWYRIDDHGDL